MLHPALALTILITGCAPAPTPTRQAPEAPIAPVEATKTTATPEAPPAAPDPLPARVVAVGDLHGDLVNSVRVLHMAGVTDEHGTWTGGDLTLVQTGDILDRGPDSKGVVELLQRLGKEARAAGGRVIPVMGNHEIMNVLGDWRYVAEADLAGFGGEGPRRAAFALDGPLGRWILENDAVVQLGEVVFAHGGVSARFAPQGAKGLSLAVRRALVGGDKEVLGDEGPLWYRGYLLAEEPLACAELKTALTAMGARRMIVGHTTQKSGRVASRCGGQLLGIDTGISEHYGTHLAAVEILSGDARALYPEGPEDLADP